MFRSRMYSTRCLFLCESRWKSSTNVFFFLLETNFVFVLEFERSAGTDEVKIFSNRSVCRRSFSFRVDFYQRWSSTFHSARNVLSCRKTNFYRKFFTLPKWKKRNFLFDFRRNFHFELQGQTISWILSSDRDNHRITVKPENDQTKRDEVKEKSTKRFVFLNETFFSPKKTLIDRDFATFLNDVHYLHTFHHVGRYEIRSDAFPNAAIVSVETEKSIQNQSKSSCVEKKQTKMKNVFVKENAFYHRKFDPHWKWSVKPVKRYDSFVQIERQRFIIHSTVRCQRDSPEMF